MTWRAEPASGGSSSATRYVACPPLRPLRENVTTQAPAINPIMLNTKISKLIIGHTPSLGGSILPLDRSKLVSQKLAEVAPTRPKIETNQGTLRTLRCARKQPMIVKPIPAATQKPNSKRASLYITIVVRRCGLLTQEQQKGENRSRLHEIVMPGLAHAACKPTRPGRRERRYHQHRNPPTAIALVCKYRQDASEALFALPL
jgi:hypothetical protein